MGAAFSVSPSPLVKFPFSHPVSFQKILILLDTSTILNCRVVCTDWRDWFTASKTIWSSVSSRMVARMLRRKMRTELEQVWNIRLGLLLKMVDECWTEEQEMTMAIRIERVTRQPIWCEFDDILKAINQMDHGLFACAGPVYIFLRSKVAHPYVLKVMGATLAEYLKCVIISCDDRPAGVCTVRRRGVDNTRWVFKDMDGREGWLGEKSEDCNEEGGEKDSLYSTAPPPAHGIFPTVLELLDCDSPWLKKMLIKKAGMDKILLVPKFEEVTKHIEDVGAQFTVAGLDMSGTVCQLDCGALAREEGAVVGYIDHPAANFSGEGVGLHFWGGRDVGQRWPVFAEILKGMDGKNEETEEEWSDVSVQWSEDDIANEVVHCNDSEESKTSDLGVSPDLSCSDSVGDSFESSCSSSDLSLSGEKNEEVSDGVEREEKMVV
eukprot:GFUD01043579.1.p1 GENE.GFUD01043579.1~~GFUD01043579.1.p1  ORF type:complete len:435 (+),score=112.83 GFUD01043579.1:35-1339(+)